MINKYLVTDLNSGDYYFFDTEKEAIARCNEIIEDYLCDGLWAEGVEDIYISKVLARSTETNIQRRPPDFEIDEDGYDLNDVHWEVDTEKRSDYMMKFSQN